MTDASLPVGRFAESDFGVGRVLGRTASVFWRNFLNFFVVTAVASVPMLWFLQEAAGVGRDPIRSDRGGVRMSGRRRCPAWHRFRLPHRPGRACYKTASGPRPAPLGPKPPAISLQPTR